jgi:VWFA-related protein
MRVRDLFFIGTVVAAGQAPPAFHTGTRIVEVTLSATSPPKHFALRDQLHTPVNDLSAADLRIFDNGVPQTIASFERIGGAVRGRNGVSVAGDASEDQRASVIVLFDSLNTAKRNQFISHDEVRKLLLRLPPETRVALVGMDEYLRVFQDFSFDREALRAAIPKYERDYAFDAFSAGEVPYANLDPRARISKSVDALSQLARLAENVRGKKNVLWMSSGFPLNVLRGELMKAVRALVAANVALYPISPEGLEPDSTDNIVELAALTGGKAFYGSNDVAGMAQAALKFTGDGYVLTFVPTDYREDGSFHQLRVETSRRQVELHYRIGYVADPSK